MAAPHSGNFPPVAFPEAVLDDSPLAYFPLREVSGSIAYDCTGKYSGAYAGSPTLGATGRTSGTVRRDRVGFVLLFERGGWWTFSRAPSESFFPARRCCPLQAARTGIYLNSVYDFLFISAAPLYPTGSYIPFVSVSGGVTLECWFSLPTYLSPYATVMAVSNTQANLAYVRFHFHGRPEFLPACVFVSIAKAFLALISYLRHYTRALVRPAFKRARWATRWGLAAAIHHSI